MDDAILWTLNGLSAGQKTSTAAPRKLNPDHLEALEDAGYIYMRISRNGDFNLLVLKEGHDAAERYRRERVAAYTQSKVKHG